jgi:hypothetical protein
LCEQLPYGPNDWQVKTDMHIVLIFAYYTTTRYWCKAKHSDVRKNYAVINQMHTKVGALSKM